jgi:chromosome segregation ATPase
MDFNAKMIELADEMDLLMRNKLSPDFCLRKMRAVARKNLPEYCTVLEEELALKAERLQDIERAGELSTGIINNLRARLTKDEDYLAELQDEYHQHIQEFKKLEDEKATQDRLITKLETENKRQAQRLQDLEQAGELSTGVINVLHERLHKDEDHIANLLDDFNEHVAKFKKLEGEKATQDRLITKLEAENKRQAEELAAAQQEVYLLKKEVDDFVKDYREAGLDPWSDNLPDVIKAKDAMIQKLSSSVMWGPSYVALNNRDHVVDLSR